MDGQQLSTNQGMAGKWRNMQNRKIRVNATLVLLLLCLLGLSCGLGTAQGIETVPGFVVEFLQEKDIRVQHSYYNGFEDLSDFAEHYIVPRHHKNSATHELDAERKFDGDFSHKAWIYAVNPVVKGANTNHRAYPTFQMKKTNVGIIKTTALVDVYVWADIDLFNQANREWFSLATFTSYDDIYWYRTYLVNVDHEYGMHLMHVPDQGVAQPDIYQATNIKMPRKTWVRVTTLIDYSRFNRFNSPIIAVWQDGELVSASRFHDRVDPFALNAENIPKCLSTWDRKDVSGAESLCGLRYQGGLAQMHFGLYAPPLLQSGVIYNDKLVVSELVR